MTHHDKRKIFSYENRERKNRLRTRETILMTASHFIEQFLFKVEGQNFLRKIAYRGYPKYHFTKTIHVTVSLTSSEFRDATIGDRTPAPAMASPTP